MRGSELTLRRDQDVEVEPTGVAPELEGPVERGERLGTAVVSVDGADEARVPLIAARSADAASLIERIDAALPGRRVGAWGLLALGALALVLIVVVPVVWLVRRGRAGG
jgi:serine-type D-Ala-D-Ala carboxypeptidase (penicillin-binding protein 5/6)